MIVFVAKFSSIFVKNILKEIKKENSVTNSPLGGGGGEKGDKNIRPKRKF